MRGTRWLLLVAIVVILCGVGLTYRAQRRALRARAPARPQALPEELSSQGEKLQYSERNENTHCKTADIQASSIRQVKDASRIDLTDVTLKLYHNCAATYDLAKSAAAAYYPAEHRLYSEGAVEITRGIPAEGQPAHTPVSIKSSGGVTFDTTTGRVETERPCTFAFQTGDGEAVGAFYDPNAHDLLMKSDVKLDWKSQRPNAKPMKIEAGSLEYRESESQIWLKPWGRLTRENTVVEGENALVTIQEAADGHKVIRKVVADNGHGVDTYPNRKVQYSAGQVWVDYDDAGLVQKITAQSNAQLVSTSASSETQVAADHFDLDFETQGGESALAHVTGTGHGTVTSKPLAAPGAVAGETHVLRSEVLEMKMRPGGHEIDNVVTHGPGTLEFLPNAPVEHHRTLDGKDMLIAYGAQNHIQSFRATDARTRTDPTADERKRNRAVSTTSSRELLAHFDPQTSRMSSMEQAGDFAYEEGEHKARAAKASLDEGQNVILLETGARVADATGSTSADRIRLDQRTGDFTAAGGVTSSRLPDKDEKKNSQMLSGDEPLQAQARKMESTNHNRTIHYEGGATMWQGANRIQADAIDVDREKRGLQADGNVVTWLWEQPRNDAATATSPPVLTVVRAPHLVYADDTRLAVYTGGVLLTRGVLRVKSRELRAYLAESGADSRLDKAFADGAVEIVQSPPDRTRNGSAEHAEYYTADQKVILRGGRPKLIEVKGPTKDTTEGNELTYFANDDRLLVNGASSRPATSQIHKGK